MICECEKDNEICSPGIYCNQCGSVGCTCHGESVFIVGNIKAFFVTYCSKCGSKLQKGGYYIIGSKRFWNDTNEWID